MNNGTENERTDKEPQDTPLSGAEELLYSIGEALRFKATKEAIASLIQRFAEDLPNRTKTVRRAIAQGHLVTVFVIISIGTLGYFKIISSETAGALLGAVVGGLYYSGRR